MPLVEWLREIRDSEPGRKVIPAFSEETSDMIQRRWIQMMITFAFSLKDLRFAGISPERLRKTGFFVRDFIAAELPLEDIMAGFRFEDFQAEGFDIQKQDWDSVCDIFISTFYSNDPSLLLSPAKWAVLIRRLSESWAFRSKACWARIATALTPAVSS